MYIVVVILVQSPVFFFRVVDYEGYVSWNLGWLDGGEICGLNFGIGVEVGNLNRPGTGASAYIDDSKRRGEGCIVEFPLECVVEDAGLVVKAY